jgi:class 3 adenylate cyclase/tetratricopeptide (TPR) repeat protein
MTDISRHTKEGERRQVTILFGDISGFTSMSEKMDPEEVTSIVNDCFGIMGSIIQKNEGTIDKYMGDCIMAIFGIPHAIEEAPQKAINAAIEMRNMIDNFNSSRNLKFPLDIHIGINTGTVVATLIGSDQKKEFTVMGDTVNIASRLKDASKKGEIFVGQNTYNLTKSDFKFQKLGMIPLKGKEEHVIAYEVLSNKQNINRSISGSNRMIQSDMVGRDIEFGQLVLHLSNVVKGKGAIINVIGEAGIGKSRLIAELQKKEETKRVTFLVGRALSFGRNLSFHPIIDILKSWTGISEEDPPSQACNKLETSINDLFPERFNETFPFIAKMMGMQLTGNHAEQVRGIEGDALERLILKCLKELLEKASARKPIVIVLEDLHWADLTSINFLISLYRLSNDNRILFINVFRPGFEETSELARKMIAERYPDISCDFSLESLAGDETEELIHSLIRIQNIPRDIKSQIVKRAGGNPFFIEEILRSFIDDGIIIFRNNNYELTDKIYSVHIPETINEVLMARIDKLEERAKSLLKVASVIGRNFYYKILAQVAEASEQIDEKLEYLEGIQLIRKRQKKLELEYLFKHALAQEATYESILLAKRKELHIKTALAIEAIFSARLHEFYGMLALHYSKGEDLDKAETYLIKAGEEALKASASSEAINYFQEALNIYKRKHGNRADPEKIVALERNIGFALHNKGQLTEAIRYFDKVTQYYGGRINQHTMVARINTLLGLFHLLIGVYFPAVKWKKNPTDHDRSMIKLYFNKLNDIAVIYPQRVVSEAFVFYRSLTHYDLSKIEGGVGMFAGGSVVSSFGGVSFNFSKKLLQSIEPQLNRADVRSVIYFEFAKILYCYLSGNWKASKDYDPVLVESALKVGDVLFTTYYLDIHILYNVELGNYNKALKLVEKLGENADKFEHDFTKGLFYKNRTKLLMKFGKYQEALLSSEEEIKFLHKINDTVQLFKGYSVRAKIQAMSDDLTGAEVSLAKAYAINITRPVPLFKIDLLLSQFVFDIHSLEKELKLNNHLSTSKSRQYILKNGLKCVALSKKVARDRTEVYKLVGTYYWLVNNQIKALSWWVKSIKEGERLNAKLELSRVYLEIGRRLSENGSRHKTLDSISSEQYMVKARHMFEELGLDRDLEALRMPVEL